MGPERESPSKRSARQARARMKRGAAVSMPDLRRLRYFGQVSAALRPLASEAERELGDLLPDKGDTWRLGSAEKRLNHIMIEVDNLDDVGLTHDVARKAKIPVHVQLGKHSNDHMYSFYFRSPSGFSSRAEWARDVVQEGKASEMIFGID